MSDVCPANVKRATSLDLSDSSGDEVIHIVPKRAVSPLSENSGPAYSSRLPEILRALEISVPSSPAPLRPLNREKRLSRETIAGVQALVGLVRQVQWRLLAKTVRAWHLKPIRLRSEMYLSKVRLLEEKIDQAAAAVKMGLILSRVASVRGINEFMTRLRLTAQRSESDVEWESAAEHIQKLRDLLAAQLLTSAIDKWELRQLFTVFISLQAKGDG